MAVDLWFQEAGQGRPLIVFIHGLCCDHTAWAPQFADLSRDHRCVAVDLRGRGASPAIPPFGVGQAAEDIATLLDRLGERAVLVGHSLGGIIALAANELAPARVLGIVTGDSPLAPGLDPEPLIRRVRELGTVEGLRPLVESFFVPGAPPAGREYAERVMYACPPDVAAGMLEDLAAHLARLPALVQAADAKPFMAIWADRPLGDPVWLRATTRFARQEPLPGTGHFFQLEQPDMTIALLRAFLDDVANDPRVA